MNDPTPSEPTGEQAQLWSLLQVLSDRDGGLPLQALIAGGLDVERARDTAEAFLSTPPDRGVLEPVYRTADPHALVRRRLIEHEARCETANPPTHLEASELRRTVMHHLFTQDGLLARQVKKTEDWRALYRDALERARTAEQAAQGLRVAAAAAAEPSSSTPAALPFELVDVPEPAPAVLATVQAIDDGGVHPCKAWMHRPTGLLLAQVSASAPEAYNVYDPKGALFGELHLLGGRLYAYREDHAGTVFECQTKAHDAFTGHEERADVIHRALVSMLAVGPGVRP